VISAGGVELVSSGGVDSGGRLLAGGSLTLLSGREADHTAVTSGASSLIVETGAVTVGTGAESGGAETISSGGLGFEDTADDCQILVSAGSVGSRLVIESGGSARLYGKMRLIPLRRGG
jgi:hypothetical protein